MPGIVVVGAGHGGVQVADSLRAGGHDGPLTLLDRAPDLPYQRPPLSKEGLADGDARTLLRGPDFYAESGIERRHAGVTSIDLAARTVALDGDDLAYDALVLATGSLARRLDVDGADLDGVGCLRTGDDATRLARRLSAGARLVVVGAGFIGLEVAAVAVARGLDVTVLETADRPMARVLTPATSTWFRDALPGEGVRVRYGVAVAGFEGDGGRVAGVRLADGELVDADVVLVGVGARADTAVAEAAGLEVDDGVVVDGALRTSDPHVLAIGDCARYPAGAAGAVRLESVQNAVAHGRHAAAVLLGQGSGPYAEVPWFWSHQGRLRLQIAGLVRDGLRVVRRGDPEAGRFSVLGYDGDALVCVESVGAPADHLAARRLLAAGRSPDPDAVGDHGFDLKAFSRTAGAATS